VAACDAAVREGLFVSEDTALSTGTRIWPRRLLHAPTVPHLNVQNVPTALPLRLTFLAVDCSARPVKAAFIRCLPLQVCYPVHAHAYTRNPTKFYVYETTKEGVYFFLHGLSPRANYTDRATAACRRSDCQLLRVKGVTWSA
jgi:hypothetical protein